MTLHGAIASITTTEVLQVMTGFAGAYSPNWGWLYDGITGTVEKVAKPFRTCQECQRERAAGDVEPSPEGCPQGPSSMRRCTGWRVQAADPRIAWVRLLSVVQTARCLPAA